jgi:O-antigen/teichoic acid export membrane protein
VLPLFLLGRIATGSLLAGYAAVGLAMSAISLRSLARLRRGQVRLPAAPTDVEPAARAQIPGLREVFAAATPYGFVTVFYLVYSQGIVSMVAAMLGPRAAGIYNAAFLVTAVVYLVPSVIYMKLLAAKLLRWWTHDRPMFVSVFHLGVAAHLGMGLACALLVAAASQWLVPLLFGPRYGDAVEVLNILAVGIPVRFVQHSYGSALFAREHIGRKIRLMGCAAVASVVLNLLLTPLLGLSGAAWSAVLSETVLLLLYMRAVACHVEGLEVSASLRVNSLRRAWGCVMRRGGTPGAVPATADEGCPP